MPNEPRGEIVDAKDRIELLKSDVDGWFLDGVLPRAIGFLLVVYVLLIMVVGVIWSGEPEVTDVRLITEEYSARENRGVVPGSYLSLIHI